MTGVQTCALPIYFPQTITFAAATKIPRLVDGWRMNIGVLVALGAVVAFWAFLFRTQRGFSLQVGGLAPHAARYAGFSSRRALWTALLASGGMAGLAGRPGGYDDDVVDLLRPLLSACGSMIEATAIDRDRREAEQALRAALEAAEFANAAKTQLLGRVSHELRTPLNAVLGFAQLLARDEQDERRARWLSQIDQAGRHVLAQVEDLLDLAAAESGRLGQWTACGSAGR